jgi:hypothetical protein
MQLEPSKREPVLFGIEPGVQLVNCTLGQYLPAVDAYCRHVSAELNN